MKTRYLALLLVLLIGLAASGQSNSGELRLKITDPLGLGVKTKVELLSEANQYHGAFLTDDAGNLVAKRLPFGVYQIKIEQEGFAPVSETLEVRSALPTEYKVQLRLASKTATVTVRAADTLIDPYRPGAVEELGENQIENRPASLPGRSLQDLVNSQPGWLYEGNAVLHPRGSEYQTQFVLDGTPLTDNRSPSFGPEIEADDVDSMAIYTSGFPAEYGRKMGGVIEVNTERDVPPGLHGDVVLTGGSFDTGGAFAQAQYVWGQNAFGVSADGSMTSRYLNPVVPENFTNTGTTADFTARYERDFTKSDHLSVLVRHALSRFEIPNEQIQETAGQLQNGDSLETMGIVSYQHIFSPDMVADLRGMVRDTSNDLWSNEFSTPTIAFLNNNFREGYFKGSISIHHGRQEWKAGVESDALSLHERFNDRITDPTQFDPGTPATFSFLGSHSDLEQSAFVQDMIRLGAWTVSAGLRWDHYQLLVNRNAVSPRLAVARYFKPADLVVHASYDRAFQTPSFENILLSSSPTIQSLNPNVLRLPVLPSYGNYFELGITKGILGKIRLEANYYRRYANNYADDDQLLNTAVSFPIAFDKSVIYGAEGKIEIPEWGRFSGFVSYSYMVGNVWLPVTGGLFLGQEATDATTDLTGHFPDSQDQRNTVRGRMRFQISKRLWAAGGLEYGSGLPFEFDGTQEEALAQYGQQVVDRINFDRGRVRPGLSVDASLGAEIYKTERLNVRMQADVENVNNRLNVIDFGGLFSGNAIGPPRSYSLRLTTSF
ncbi:MAG: TonB-dependent receptor [Candidatus Acidiferrales bacterium]